MNRHAAILAGAGLVTAVTGCARKDTAARLIAAAKAAAQKELAGRAIAGSKMPPAELGRWGSLHGGAWDFTGRVTLANLWATWCPPCRHEMPQLERLFRTYAKRGFVVVGIDEGEEPDKVGPFLRKMGVTYPILLDSTLSYGDQLQIRALPTSIFVRTDGIIDSVYVGELSYDHMVKLAEAALRNSRMASLSQASRNQKGHYLAPI